MADEIIDSSVSQLFVKFKTLSDPAFEDINKSYKRGFSNALRASKINRVLEAVNGWLTLVEPYLEDSILPQQHWGIIGRKLRKALFKAKVRLEVPLEVPTEPFPIFGLDLPPEENLPDPEAASSVNLSQSFLIMDYSKLEWLKPFNGEPGKLQAFLDALALVKVKFPTHEEECLLFIKTRLEGKARDVITDDVTSISQVETLLKAKFGQKLNINLLKAQLAGKKQTGDLEKYAREISELTDSLERAYLQHGVVQSVAEKLAQDEAIEAMVSNCSQNRVRTILSSNIGKSSLAEASAVLLRESKREDTAQILNYRRNWKNKNSRGNFNNNNYNGNGRKGKNNDNNSRNNNQNYRRNDSRGNNNSYNNRRNGNRNQNSRRVNCTSAQGNDQEGHSDSQSLRDLNQD